MASRYYSSVAAVTTLSNGVSPSGTSFIVGSTSGFPVQTPFTLLINEGTQSEEIVTVTNVAGTTLTVTRGEDGTVAVAHDPGARVRHAMTARDLRESREHEDKTANVHGVTGALASASSLSAHAGANSGVHGVSGSVVGTSGAQTLTSKTMSGASNTFSNIPQSAVAGLTDTWQSYTPTVSGLSVGNGSLAGRYIQIGKTVHFILNFTAGSTSNFSGLFTFDLPVPANSNPGSVFNAQVQQGGTRRAATGTHGGGTFSLTTDSGQVSNASPWTWQASSNNIIRVQGTYEAA